MSLRFWIAAGGVALSAAVAGYGLGGFAGGRFAGGVWGDRSTSQAMSTPNSTEESDVAFGQKAQPNPAEEAAPEKIVCKGCGPTLAERQMTADAYATGASDPVLAEYATQDSMATVQPDRGPPNVVATIRPPTHAPTALLGAVGDGLPARE